VSSGSLPVLPPIFSTGTSSLSIKRDEQVGDRRLIRELQVLTALEACPIRRR
jgi:hypothetical protein